MNLKKSLMLCERPIRAGWFCHALPQKTVNLSTFPRRGPPLYFKCGCFVCAADANFSDGRCPKRIFRTSLFWLISCSFLVAVIYGCFLQSLRNCVQGFWLVGVLRR